MANKIDAVCINIVHIALHIFINISAVAPPHCLRRCKQVVIRGEPVADCGLISSVNKLPVALLKKNNIFHLR